MCSLYLNKSLNLWKRGKTTKVPTLCHLRKEGILLLLFLSFLFFFVRTATESCFAFSTVEPASNRCHAMNNTPLFLRFFTLCQRNVQGCDRSVQFACRIPSGGLLKCLHFLGAASHLSKLDPLSSQIAQQVLKSLINNNFSHTYIYNKLISNINH